MHMLLDQYNVVEIRKQFPALQQTFNQKPIVFLDGPGGTQVHASVIQVMERYYRSANSNAHGAFLYSQRTDEITYRARQSVADFLNAPRPEEIVFGPNMTTLTFRMSQAIGTILNPGEKVVLTRLDHDANIAPWVSLKEKGIEIDHVAFDPTDCTLDMERMEQAINSGRTKIVAVGYASNAVGTINDVRKITEMAHHAGAWIYIDAVHYAPHGSIDVQSLQCDFLVCSAYKFFGPHLGILFGKHALLEALPARKVRPAGNMPPDKFETGTNSFEAISGAAAAIDYLASLGPLFEDNTGGAAPSDRKGRLKGAMTAIRSYEKMLCREMIAGLGEIRGLRIYGITEPEAMDRRVPTVSFTIEGRHPKEIARELNKRNIFVWDGNFYALAVTEDLSLEQKGGMVRVGLCHYNTIEEVQTLIDEVSEIAR
jgi:cysteine desulfurase family protein (TIGR01976 family)